MLAQIVGFVFMCVACGFFGLVFLFTLFAAPQFEGRAGSYLFGFIMFLMSLGMGYAAYCNSPFHITLG